MHKKITLIIATGLLSLLATVSLVTFSSTLIILYVVASGLLMAAVCVGGCVDYNRQDMQDVRDIYRERIRLLTEKLQAFHEANGKVEKAQIKRGRTHQNHANRKSSSVGVQAQRHRPQ